MRKSFVTLAVAVATLGLAFFFQNCGPGFKNEQPSYVQVFTDPVLPRDQDPLPSPTPSPSPSPGTMAVIPGMLKNSWTEITFATPPASRYGHSAVWTGSRMIVWGGYSIQSSSFLSSGAIFDPSNNSWAAVSTQGAPSARGYHSAVWTGTRMLVFGGSDANLVYSDLYSYDPAGNTWTELIPTQALPARQGHTAIWTGTRMIVFGGSNSARSPNTTDQGFSFDPVTGSSTAIANGGAILSKRMLHSAAWSGDRMLIYGGTGDGTLALANGAIYNPANNSWTATSAAGTPPLRQAASVVWSGNKFILFGGYTSTNGTMKDAFQFDPLTNLWSPLGVPAQIESFGYHSAVWTGTKMVIFGGGKGTNANFIHHTKVITLE